ncbi:1199_t:CDS:10, partial [Acaulospora colombiana]
MQTISPNPLGSLLNTFNSQIASPTPTPPIVSIGVTQMQGPLNSQNVDSGSVGIDEASTKILKEVLFGHASQTPSQQENEVNYQSETLMASAESAEDDEDASPEDASEVEVIDYNDLYSLDSIKPSVSASISKPSPTSTSNSVFTYSNPFEYLKNSSPPSPSNLDLQLPHKKGESSTPKDGGVYKPQQQKEPELSTWDVCESGVSKGQSSIPDGVRLPRGIILYHTGELNEKILSPKGFHCDSIALVNNDLEHRPGKSIAINRTYICYAIRGGKIRVISSEHGNKVMLKNHEKQILDMCIQETSHDEHQAEKQLLLAIGADSKIVVWELLPSESKNNEIIYKIVLQIDAKEIQEDSKQPRYHRAIWHPLNRNLFAVATDANDALIFDISEILGGNETGSFKESEITGNFLKSEAHEKPINDLAFSPDGSILAMASGDSVIFYTTDFSTAINPVHRIILDGQLVSSVMFVEGGYFNSEPSLSLKVRYVIIGTERNTILNLYDIESAEYIQSIKFLPPPERRPSLNKASRKEESMFNCVGFNQSTRTLIVSNSARNSIFAFHINIPSRNFDLTAGGNMEYGSTSDDYSIANSVQFDYMVELPINHLIRSFVVMPDTNTSGGILLYCIHPKEVHYYTIFKDTLLPQNVDACPEYACDLDRQQQEVKDDIKKEVNTNDFPEAQEIISQMVNSSHSSVEEAIFEKDIVKESLVTESSTTEGLVSETNAANPDLDEAILTEKGNVMFGNIQDSALIVEENANKNSENQKLQKSKSAGQVNGTKSKTRKANAVTNTSAALTVDALSDSEKTNNNKKTRRGEKDNENLVHSPETSNKSAGKKFAEGGAKNNGKSGVGGAKKVNEASQVSGGKPYPVPDVPIVGSPSSSGISSAQMQMIMKEIKKMEDIQKIEEERIAHQAAETSRQETILKMVSQTLSTNTSKLLESTIRNEIQISVLPTLSKMVTNAVDKHAHRGITDAVNKSIPAAIEKSVADNVQRVLAKTPVIDSIAKAVSKAIRPVIEETFRDNFTTVLIPSYQKATNAMFEQITATFEAGMQDIAVKSAQASSYNNTANVDKNALARLQVSVENLTQQLNQLQGNLTGHGGHQNQLARSLSDELKRILNPQNSNTSQQPSVSQQEPYIYGRASSSQQPQQQHQSQLFSPADPPNLVEYDRSLEAGNYEDAFVAVLSTHEIVHILRLCHKLSPKTVFLPARSLVTQPVILSLIHHLSFDLHKYSELKLSWIEEAVLKLNPKDSTIREHCERLLPMVRQRLEQYYCQVLTQDPSSP